MDARMKKIGNTVRESKFLVAAALILVGWLAVFGAVAAEMGQAPLKDSIERVLSEKTARPDFMAR